MNRRLITSALPYVNNVPHLGNLIQVLSADVFARFCRLRGYDTLYICGTDEYGTATETRAAQEKIEPKELCDRYYRIHAELYEWFQINFDHFGRSSDPVHTDMTQGLFLKLRDNQLIQERTITQLYSEQSKQFLADRYVIGTCPHCTYEAARGDQCEQCGKLLDPTDLINPRSAIDDSQPIPRETNHLYLDLPAMSAKLSEWIEQGKGRWSKNALKMSQAWLRDGLRERAITRDLRWGIPVPGYESKVFYVWFDAPIGYISITAQHSKDWEQWWLSQNDVQLFQFVGKDNIPFHTVLFPAILMGSKQPWTMLHNISATEYMNYEGGMFSKSRGIGIFADDAQNSQIPAAVWRFYLMYNRPENSDYNFSWLDFQRMVNTELIGNFSNLVNRVLSFASRYFDGQIIPVTIEAEVEQELQKHHKAIEEYMEEASLRQALREIFALSDYANRLFQHRTPWNLRKTDPDAAHHFISQLVYILRDLAVLIAAFLPDIADRIASFLGLSELRWSMLGSYDSISQIQRPDILFARLEDEMIEELRQRFSGKQQNLATVFAQRVRLSAAKIISVEQHPNADKLYVLQLDIGEEETRTIVSGLVGHYSPEDLVEKTIVLVRNLKPAQLRGIKSNGMLLAAGDDADLEVIFLDDVRPGSDLALAGQDVSEEDRAKLSKISPDDFRSFPLCLDEQGQLSIDATVFLCEDKAVCCTRLRDCAVG